MSRILVLSPHPDDEAIGCGGALHGHSAVGDEIKVVFLTSGEAGGHGRTKAETQKLREAEATAAGEILGVSSLEFWRQPDGALAANRSLVDRLEELISNWSTDYIYVPHDREAHGDHRAAARLLKGALARNKLIDKMPVVRKFEVWTPLEVPDEIIDISASLDTKLAAIRAHKTQCAAMDFEAASRSLSRYRGEMHCWPGGDYAEVFMN